MARIHSPMAGNVWKITVAVGDTIDFGDTVAILESMKMEIPVEADGAGKVTRILVETDTPIDQGDAVVEYE